MSSPDFTVMRRCSDCNDEWLNGNETCRSCRQPLLVPARDLAITVLAPEADAEPELGTWQEAGRYFADELRHEWRSHFAAVWQLFKPAPPAQPETVRS